jgi:peptidoglycan/LPS O-acetylase OafA/YrhL
MGIPDDEGERTESGRIGYRPALDGLRAVAIIGVMIAHSFIWFPGLRVAMGGVGVDLFFVLSGFLITSLLLREHETDGSISRTRFYVRRALRLLPALAVALVVVGVLSVVLHANLSRHNLSFPRSALVSLFFAGNWFQYQLGALAHTWSLAVEEQYYLIWPTVLVLALRAKVSKERIAAMLVAAIIVIASMRSLLYGHHELTALSTPWTFVHLWVRTDGVLIGSLLAILLASDLKEHVVKLLRSRLVCTAAVAIVLALAVRPVSAWTASNYDELIVFNVCFALVVGHVFTAPSGRAARILRTQPLPALGKVSYGLYLFHWPIYNLTARTMTSTPRLAVAVALVATLSLAVVSYHLVERPALRLKPWIGLAWLSLRRVPSSVRQVDEPLEPVVLARPAATVSVRSARSPVGSRHVTRRTGHATVRTRSSARA